MSSNSLSVERVSVCLVVLLLAVLPPDTIAWGSHELRAGGSSTTRLNAHDWRKDDEYEVIEAYRERLQTIYDPNLHLRQMEKDDEERLSFLKDRADELAVETFSSYDSGVDSCGEDCEDFEDCAIPDDWKLQEQVDVMQFLGIRRAQPLRKPQDFE